MHHRGVSQECVPNQATNGALGDLFRKSGPRTSRFTKWQPRGAVEESWMLGLSHRLSSLPDLASYRQAARAELGALLPGDNVFWTEVDYERGVGRVECGPEGEAELSPWTWCAGTSSMCVS